MPTEPFDRRIGGFSPKESESPQKNSNHEESEADTIKGLKKKIKELEERVRVLEAERVSLPPTSEGPENFGHPEIPGLFGNGHL